jgi:hypothetical protein
MCEITEIFRAGMPLEGKTQRPEAELPFLDYPSLSCPSLISILFMDEMHGKMILHCKFRANCDKRQWRTSEKSANPVP